MGTKAAPAQRGASTLWIMLLTIASTVATLALACATPFAALAALAATQMRTRDGIWLMLATWAASQAVGFGVLHYPHTGKTIAWGVALGLAAVAGLVAARLTLARLSIRGTTLQLALALVVATLAFKMVIVLFSLGLGGLQIALSPTYTLQQVAREAAMLVGLLALYRILVTAGVPAARPNPARA